MEMDKSDKDDNTERQRAEGRTRRGMNGGQEKGYESKPPIASGSRRRQEDDRVRE